MPSRKLENAKNVRDRISVKSQLNLLGFADTEHFIEQFTGRAKIDIPVISFANST